ncbi:hypothetical protein CYMTET_6385 [Cymbomonas tetramitiformis]|uniref:Apple domain-containing protein n=1 Tax=Cymbomonas tetramitiformis TaxID=36881 RepID=A0AAE0LII9_9CHLO|nr:hypothetical protein CYMTET_6385 [Cymbomonas tetramitiformis]
MRSKGTNKLLLTITFWVFETVVIKGELSNFRQQIGLSHVKRSKQHVGSAHQSSIEDTSNYNLQDTGHRHILQTSGGYITYGPNRIPCCGEGTDLAGQLTGKSLAQCKALCDANSACVGISWNNDYNDCYLKSHTEYCTSGNCAWAFNAPDWEFHQKCDGYSTYGPNRIPCNGEGTDLAGQLTGKSLAQCKALCHANSACAGISWNNVYNDCYLKSDNQYCASGDCAWAFNAPDWEFHQKCGARKKSILAELVRVRVQQMLAGEWDDHYRAAAPSAPVWLARASEERIVSDVSSLVKKGQLGKAIQRLDPGVLAPLEPETLEALEALHPSGDGLPAPVRVAPLVLEEAAVEAECRQMPVASGLGCSQLQFEHLSAIFGAGDGVPAIQYACEQDRVQQAHFGAPPGDGAASSAAQVEVEVQGGAEVCVHMVQALLGAMPSWCALKLDYKNAFNSVHRQAIHRAVYTIAYAILRAYPEVYIIAYLDDIHILGEPEHVRAAYDTAVLLLANIGLELNCEDFRDVVDAAGDSIPGADVALEGIKAQLLLLRYCAHPSEAHAPGEGMKPRTLMFGAIEHDSGVQRCLQEISGSPYPLAWQGGSGVEPAANPVEGAWVDLRPRLAPVGWLGSGAHVWKRMVVMFPVVRGLLPHLGAPEGTDAGGHPLVAGLFSAMEDVRGARLRVLAAEAAAAERQKALVYGDVAPHKLAPFAVEVFGGLGAFGLHGRALEDFPQCNKHANEKHSTICFANSKPYY